MDLLSREQIIEAFERLDASLGKQGVKAELFLVGGAVMCLALDPAERLAVRTQLLIEEIFDDRR